MNTVKNFYNQADVHMYVQKIKECLPVEYLVSEDYELYYNGNKISNFIPLALKKISLISVHSGEVTHKVVVSGVRKGILYSEKEIDISALDTFDFQQQISNTFWVNCLNKEAKKIFAFFLRIACSEADSEEIYTAERLGFFEVGNHRGYVMGDDCITNSSINIRIADNIKEYKLLPQRYAENIITDATTEIYLKDLIGLNRRLAPVLLAGDVIAITSSLFSKAGYPIRFSLYARGEQSTGKTTLVTHACSMYRREEDIEATLHNLTATEAKLHQILDREADSPIIVDDLRKSDSAATLKAQEKALDALIRVAANKVGRATMKYEYDVRGFCIFIGEYNLKTPSTNNRIVLLNFLKQDLNKEQLIKVTREPERLSLFFYWFIKWVMANYDQLVSKIKMECEHYYRERSKKEQYQERLNSHANALSIAFNLLLEFCEEKRWDLGIGADEFNLTLKNIIAEQIDCLELGDKNRPNHLVELFYQVRQELDFQDNAEVDPKLTYWNQSLYFNKKKRLMCIPSPTIEKMLKRAQIRTEVPDAMNDFKLMGLLHVDNSKDAGNTKKVAGKRCYVISYDLWADYVRDMVEESEEFD